MIIGWRIFGIFLVAGGVAFASVAGAEMTDKKKRELMIREAGTKYVQMESFMAPTEVPGRLLPRKTPITVVLEVPDHNKVGQVCRLGARVRAKLLETLYRQPIPVNKDRTINPDPILPSLTSAANRAIGEQLVSTVYVLSGSRSMGGGAIAKLPFHKLLGCKEIELPEEADKKKEEEQQD